MLDESLVAQMSGAGAGALVSVSGTIVELWWRVQFHTADG
jgi:hypothetical protein